MNVIDFGDALWAEDPAWTCTIGSRDIKLGAFFLVLDGRDWGEESSRPWIVIAQIYPQPDEIPERIMKKIGGSPNSTRKQQISRMTGYTPGVPFDPQANRPVADRIAGKKLSTGMKMPLFATAAEARAFCREAAQSLPEVFKLLDVFLAWSVNIRGEDGRSFIRNIVGVDGRP